MNISKYAIVLGLSTAFISGFSGFINKFAVSSFDNPILFAAIKNGVVAFFILGILIVLNRWHELKALNKKLWLQLICIGIIGGGIPFALFFTGLAQTSAVNGALIHKTLFLFVAMFAIPFLKEHVAWQQWVGIGIIFLANFLVGGYNDFKFNAGEFMILGATILWAIENIIAKKTLENVSSLTVAGARMFFGSVLLIIYVSLTSDFQSSFVLSPTQLGWVMLTSIFLLGYVLTWYSALKRAPATLGAILLVPATIITNVLSAIFITHTFSVENSINLLCYLVGISIIIWYAKIINYQDKTVLVTK